MSTFDPFKHLGLDLAAKKAKHAELSQAYLDIASGDKENYINDFGSGHVIYTSSNLSTLERLINMLDQSIQVEEGAGTDFGSQRQSVRIFYS